MKAAILFNLNQPLELITEINLPDLKRGQVLVRLAYSGICHSQLMEVRGRRGPDKYLPHLLGHEGSGIVEAVGLGVTKVKPGDRVILGWIKGSGIDAGGTVYTTNNNTINAGGVTTFSDYTIASENRCVQLPQGVPMDIAVLFGCAIPTGAGIITNTIQPRDDSTIAIFGLGGIGMSAIMATQLFKCKTVIAVDVEDSKLALASKFGATMTINSTHQNPVSLILDHTGGHGVDYSVEAAGLTATIEQAFKVVRNHGGRCVFASHPEYGAKISIDPYDLICGKSIEGSWGGDCNPDRDIPRFAELYKQGRLPLEKLITKRYSLDEINDAIDDLEQRRVGRPLIVIDEKIRNI